MVIYIQLKNQCNFFKYLIRIYTNAGDLVLDNCIGSGPKAIACLNTSRDFIGIENNKKYIDLVLSRIRDNENNKVVFSI